MKKALLAILIAGGLIWGGVKFTSYVRENTPLAKAGECIALEVEGQAVAAVVLDNNARYKASILMDQNGGLHVATWKQLREAKGHRIDCGQ